MAKKDRAGDTKRRDDGDGDDAGKDAGDIDGLW